MVWLMMSMCHVLYIVRIVRCTCGTGTVNQSPYEQNPNILYRVFVSYKYAIQNLVVLNFFMRLCYILVYTTIPVPD